MFDQGLHISSESTLRRKRASENPVLSLQSEKGVRMSAASSSRPVRGTGRDPRSLRLERGFSMLELMMVLLISLCVAAYAIPNFMTAYYNNRLKSAASDLSGLMQRARIQAARQNATYTLAYQHVTNAEEACIDLNNNLACDPGEPTVTFSSTVTPAAGAPSGTPSPYVLVGDTAGTTYDNATTLGYSPRGLPCAYSSGLCVTPAAGYFVYYLKDQRPTSTGWAAVVVTRGGRTKAVVWNGASWQ
jgi:prepilin-type N-terminal cleavage/methylation domain-containing protein